MAASTDAGEYEHAFLPLLPAAMTTMTPSAIRASTASFVTLENAPPTEMFATARLPS
jgi:hypothetical protein